MIYQKKPYLKKVKAGALLLVLGIALILFMLIGFFILRKGLTHRLLASVNTEEQLRYNIQSAILFLENIPQENRKDNYEISLFPELGDSTKIELKKWGFYDLGYIHSNLNGQSKKAVYLLGNEIGTKDQLPSLYFSDPDRYLSVGGYTYLGTNTYLPRFGIRKAYVKGVGYYRKKLVFGKSYQAELKLPQLSNKITDRFNHYIHSDWETLLPNQTKDIHEREEKIKQSFENDLVMIDSEEDIDLRGVSIIGNIIIRSKGDIIIDSTTTIDQSIIIGESIKIEKSFNGRGQFIATNSISIGKNGTFTMPSILAVFNTTDSCSINLDKYVNFSGNILFQSPNNELVPKLKIAEGCKLIGQVYCNAYCDFDGVLFGSLYTRGFIKITPTSFNQNYLLNACIDVDRMPEEFCGLNMINNQTKHKCIDKLY